jgi:hypothetical protein
MRNAHAVVEADTPPLTSLMGQSLPERGAVVPVRPAGTVAQATATSRP